MTATAPARERNATPAARSMGWPRALLAMTRPAQIALIAAIVVNGLLLALWRTPGSALPIDTATMALALAVITAAAVHLSNEAADYQTDLLTERTPFSGGSGALAASGLHPRVPLATGLSLAGLAIVAGVVSMATGLIPPAGLALLLIGLVGGLAYSLPPVAAMRRGWGEPLNAVLGSVVLPLFAVAAILGTIGMADVLAFLPFFFVTFASVMATAWPDREADAATGKATMQVRLAPARLRMIHATASIAFVAATIVAAAVDALPLVVVGLLVLPLVVVGTVRYTRSPSPLANVSAMVGLTLITTASLAVSLAARETA